MKWFGLVVFAGLLGIAAALLAFGIWIPNFPSKENYPVRGIDVSHHQGEIDWSRVRREVHFAYLKATEGRDFRDVTFARNWRESAMANVVHGAYHFYLLGVSGRDQFENFAGVVPVDPTALPPVLDLEISGYNRAHRQPVSEFQRELTTIMQALREHYGKEAVIYTTADFQREYLKGMTIERLWLREVMMKPRGDWMFWQFSARGRLPGVPGFVDLNVFRGDESKFNHLLGKADRADDHS